MLTRLLSLVVAFTITLSASSQLSLNNLIQTGNKITDTQVIAIQFGEMISVEANGLFLGSYDNLSSYVELAPKAKTSPWTHNLDTTATYVYAGAHLFGWESVIYAGGTRSSSYNDYYLAGAELPLFTFPLLKNLITDYYSYTELSPNSILHSFFISPDKKYMAIVTGHSYPYGNQTSWDKHEYYYFKRM